MKYRMMTNGNLVRIQYRVWFWPFWIYAKSYHEAGYSYLTFDTKERAQKLIDKWTAEYEADRRKWVPV